jgi:hypothetical protein
MEREARRHAAAIRTVMLAIRSGDCTPEMGSDAIDTLIDYYDITGMSIDKAIPPWLRKKET